MKALTLLLILCAPVALLAQSGTQLTPLASGGEIKAAIYSDAAHGSLFAGLDATLKRYGVVITNTTNQPVIACLIRWDWTDPDSKPRILSEQKDTTGTLEPIAGANSTFCDVAPTSTHGPRQQSGVRMVQDACGLLTAPTVKVTIDMMISRDGQVIGPDNGHLQANLQAQFQAVGMLRRDQCGEGAWT